MSQQLRVPAALLQDMRSVPKTHIRALATSCIFRGSTVLFYWPLQGPPPNTILKILYIQGTVAHTYNPSPYETDSRGFP